ncbi:MAG: carotenoid biosynthesis protein [Prolixibacteraceae bacterium]|nr:carotenoid biosynthesis protein [Prolixibacteraceae bacterium]
MNRIVLYFKNLTVRDATRFLIVFYIVGIIGFFIPYSREIFEKMIPLSLLVNLFLLFLFHKPYNVKHLAFFGSVVLLTFLIEAVGMNTGVLFGEYLYGESLPVKLFGTPIIIGLNWLLLSYGVVQLMRMNKQLRRYIIILGAAAMTLFDFMMEPVAMKTGMWSWSYNIIPWQNFIMWFILSAIIIAGFELFSIKTDNKIAGRIFLFQLFFFVVLNIFLK